MSYAPTPTDSILLESALERNSSFANISNVYGNFSGMMPPPTSTWGWWLLQIGTLVIVLVGIPGNILSFLVMKSRRFRNKSYSHYLCTLAVFDSLVLLAKFLKRVNGFLRMTGQPALDASYGDAGCKIYDFVEHVCYLMSSWLVLCMTLERFIAVNYPFKKDMLCKPRNAVTVILVVFAVMSYSQTFRLIMVEQDNGQCGAPLHYRTIYIELHIYMYQLVMQFMLPALLILVCNMMILCKIRRLRFSFAGSSIHHHHANAEHPYAKRYKTTCMLLIVSFTYVVALFPQVVLSLTLHMAVSLNRELATSIMLNLNGVDKLLELISELNYGINFYIYVLSGAQFRYALRYMCTRRYAFISSPAQTEKVFHFNKKSGNDAIRLGILGLEGTR